MQAKATHTLSKPQVEAFMAQRQAKLYKREPRRVIYVSHATQETYIVTAAGPTTLQVAVYGGCAC